MHIAFIYAWTRVTRVTPCDVADQGNWARTTVNAVRLVMKWKKNEKNRQILETWDLRLGQSRASWDLRLETWANLRGLAKYLYNTRASCMIITTYSPLSHTKIPVRQFCRAVPQHCCALGGFATKCTRNTFTYSCKCAHITGTAVHEHVAGTMIFGAIHVHVHVHVPRYRYLAVSCSTATTPS